MLNLEGIMIFSSDIIQGLLNCSFLQAYLDKCNRIACFHVLTKAMMISKWSSFTYNSRLNIRKMTDIIKSEISAKIKSNTNITFEKPYQMIPTKCEKKDQKCPSALWADVEK